jgi:sigma-B regulation protein RsbU (phosphoserine phosphatase)
MFFSVADSDESPAEAIRRVNGALVRRSVESRFATVFHGLLTPQGRLLVCNAGHNPPLLLRTDGSTQWLTEGGLLLGVFGEAKFVEQSLELSAGDTLVLFSDGVTEAADAAAEQFGEERILSTLSAARFLPVSEIVDRLLAEVRAFAGEEAQADDITILVVRYVGSGPGPDGTVTTSPASAS